MSGYPKLYTTDEHLPPTFVNSQLFSTTFHQLFFNSESFLYFVKKKCFLWSFRIIIRFTLLYFLLSVYMQELFPVSWRKLHDLEHLSVRISYQPLTCFEPII